MKEAPELTMIEYLYDTLPEVCVVRDLIKVGFYRTPQAAYAARKRGDGPPAIRLPGRGIVYLKDGIIEYVRELKKKDPRSLLGLGRDP